MEELTKETIKFYTSILPFLTVIIPILGSFIILFAGDKHPKLRNTVTVITTGLTFFLVVLMYPTVITKGMT
ncbi:MAG: hypothetical protein HY776_00145, partial [Actinobacteria bacterium]|nr:hypothetical protein [Actinomycetota bacterium]